MTLYNIFTICRKELNELSKDRRTIFFMFISPLIISPIIVYLFSLLWKNPSHQIALVVLTSFFQFMPIFLISLTGHVGLDITTGEKERNTLETSLTLFASRKELVLGKYLSIVSICLIAASVMFLIILVSYFASAAIFAQRASLELSKIMLKGILCYLVFSVYYAVFFSAIILIVGLLARSLREAFSLMNPIFMVGMLLPIAGPAFGLKLSYFTACIPGLNYSLILRQYLASSVNWIYWFILLFSLLTYTFVAIKYAFKLIERDAVLNRI